MHESNARNEDKQIERDQIMQAFVHVSFTQHTYRNPANYKHSLVNKEDKGRKNGLFNNMIKASSLRKWSGTRQGLPLSPILFNTLLDILARTIRQKKEIIGIQIGKEVAQLPLLTNDMILHAQNCKETTKKLLELISKSSR